MTEQAHTPEELADYLDEVLSHGVPEPARNEADPLVETALRLTNAAHPEPSLQTATRIQARMLAEIPKSPRQRRARTHSIARRILPLNRAIQKRGARVRLQFPDPVRQLPVGKHVRVVRR